MMVKLNHKVVDPISSYFQEGLQSISEVQSCTKGDLLFMAGQPADDLYLVKSGFVRISITTGEGKDLLFGLCQKGDLVGEFNLSRSPIVHTTTSEMMTDGELYIFSRVDFEHLLMKDAKIAVEFLKLINLLNLRSESKFRDLMLYGKDGAFFSTLIRLCNTFGTLVEKGIMINLPLTHQDLAKLIGSSRETVSRFIIDLKSQNIVSVLDGFLVIHDLNFLKKAIKCENCEAWICKF